LLDSIALCQTDPLPVRLFSYDLSVLRACFVNVQRGQAKGSSVAQAAAAIPGISEMFAYHATTMANTMQACLLVFTRKVHLAVITWRSIPCTGLACPIGMQQKGADDNSLPAI
jgi:hypothetical protein